MGIGSGIVGHCAVAFLGLGWLVREIPGFTIGLTIAGALLLTWIGLSALRAPWATPRQPGDATDILSTNATRPTSPDRHARTADLARDYRNGLLTNLLNGKALLFFVTLGMATLARHPPTWVVASLFSWLPLMTAAWFCGIAWIFGHPRLQRRLVRAAPWLDKAMGVILLLLAVWLASSLVVRA